MSIWNLPRIFFIINHIEKLNMVSQTNEHKKKKLLQIHPLDKN